MFPVGIHQLQTACGFCWTNCVPCVIHSLDWNISGWCLSVPKMILQISDHHWSGWRHFLSLKTSGFETCFYHGFRSSTCIGNAVSQGTPWEPCELIFLIMLHLTLTYLNLSENGGHVGQDLIFSSRTAIDRCVPMGISFSESWPGCAGACHATVSLQVWEFM